MTGAQHLDRGATLDRVQHSTWVQHLTGSGFLSDLELSLNIWSDNPGELLRYLMFSAEHVYCKPGGGHDACHARTERRAREKTEIDVYCHFFPSLVKRVHRCDDAELKHTSQPYACKHPGPPPLIMRNGSGKRGRPVEYGKKATGAERMRKVRQSRRGWAAAASQRTRVE